MTQEEEIGGSVSLLKRFVQENIWERLPDRQHGLDRERFQLAPAWSGRQVHLERHAKRNGTAHHFLH